MNCSCSKDAQAFIGGVWITGHNRDCVNAEPRQYVWLVFGTMYVGTLADYARHLERGHYTGDEKAISSEIRTWETTYTPVVTGGDKFNDNSYAHITVTVENESVTYQIDGRA